MTGKGRKPQPNIAEVQIWTPVRSGTLIGKLKYFDERQVGNIRSALLGINPRSRVAEPWQRGSATPADPNKGRGEGQTLVAQLRKIGSAARNPEVMKPRDIFK